jgi:asparagine synthase (glutamine-hydrolysing)
MCGITGILHRDGSPASPVVLRRMTDVIAHRGPDGEGQYTDGALGLGHRRLAIIDLSPAGHQPMMTPDGRYVITYNGEIYNFQEIRIELESHGWAFHSRTDTEVLLKGYAHWGAAVLEKLNGMFAFAIWDRREKSLFLARDRYGIKPLYYATCGSTFLFGSEIKALCEHPEFRRSLDLEGLLEYFTFQNFFTDRTLFNGVRLLPSGCSLTLAHAKEPQVTRYWDFQFQEPEESMDVEEAVEELDRLFRQSVKRQLVGDVDVGSYLSGGMDSGSITAIASREVPLLRTFTCGFDLRSASGMELSFDERDKAEHMSYLFKTEHYEMILKSGDLERVMPRFAWHLEEPRVGQSYPNFYAAQLAGKFVKVCLSGCGGDELFGGYPWRYYRAAVNADFDAYIDKYYAYWQRLIPSHQISEVFKPVWNQVSHVQTRDIFRNVFSSHAGQLTRPEDYINHSLYFEAKTFMHGLLVVEDKLSMAHGLETRVPFLDNDLVDFAMRLPVAHKLRNLGEVVRLNENDPGSKAERYFQRTNDGKIALRKVMSRYVPESISSGEKQGFSAPDASWFKGESIDYVRDELLSSKSRIWDVLDRSVVSALVQDHLDGRENRRLLIWSLLNVEWMMRKFSF